MTDIITSIPWHCGNSDGCNVGWHRATQTWEVAFRPSIGGTICCWGRRNRRGPPGRADALRAQVRDYLRLERREGAARNYYYPEGMEQLKRDVAQEGCKVIRDRSLLRFILKVEVSQPRPESAVKRDLIQAASK